MSKPKFSLDQPSPISNSDLPEDHQDMWRNIINEYGSIYPTILNLFHERRNYGIECYKTPLQVSNGRNAIADLISEHLDAIVYAEIIRLEKPYMEEYIRNHQKYLLDVIERLIELMNTK